MNYQLQKLRCRTKAIRKTTAHTTKVAALDRSCEGSSSTPVLPESLLFLQNLSQGATRGIPGHLSEARPKKLNWRFFLPPVIGKHAAIHSVSW